MQIILLERVEKLGHMGDVVSVKPGFARNFLLPMGKALRATKDNIADFESKRAALEAESKDKRTAAEGLSKQMEGTKLIIVRHASEMGVLYGSVSPRDIADLMVEKGFDVNKNMVRIHSPIKSLGIHSADILLHPEVHVAITLSVAPSEEEAKILLEKGVAQENEEVEEIVEDVVAEVMAEIEKTSSDETDTKSTEEVSEEK